MFIDISQVVNIIQKLNIMSCFHSLHVDIFGKHLSWFVLCCVFYLCMAPHIQTHLQFHLSEQFEFKKIIEAWWCDLPTIPIVVFCCVELPWLILFSSFWDGRCFSSWYIVWTYLTWKPLCVLFSWKIQGYVTDSTNLLI